MKEYYSTHIVFCRTQ